MAKSTFKRRTRSTAKDPSFFAEPLETRTLLAATAPPDVEIGSPLEGAGEFAVGGKVTVSPNAMIMVDIKAIGTYAAYGGSAPTGTVQIGWQPGTYYLGAGGVGNILTSVTLAPAGTDSLGDWVSTASALFPLPVFESTIIAGNYLGDSNYLAIGTATSVSVGLNQAPKLAFIQNPSNTPVGALITPAVTVAYEDQSGNILTADNNYAFLSIASGPITVFNAGYGPGGHGYSSGDQTENAAAVDGIATFSNLQISTNNVNISPIGTYTLAATDADLDGQPDMASPATSTPFNITSGGGLAFTVQPTGAAANNPLTPPVVVELRDDTGAVETSDSSTVITLSPIGSNSANPITGNTATLVHGEATFSNLKFTVNGVYQLQATDPANDAPASSSTFKIGTSSLGLEIISKIANPTKGVASGDHVFYDLLVTSKKALQSDVITDTLPAGFTPTNITDKGTLTGNTITWNTTDKLVSFDVVVPNAKTLNGLTKIVTNAEANATYTDSTTDVADAADTVKIASSFTVTGTLHDAQFQFPSKLTVVTTAPLGKITVNLIDSTGATVDTQTTKGNGTFSVGATKAGTYTLEFVALADVYSTASNGISTQHVYAGQSVTIPPSNTKPIDVGDLYLPQTFFTTASKVLNSLNNYTTSGFQNLQSFKLDLLQFDTTQPESVVNALLGTASNPTPLLNEKSLHIGGPTDPWVTAMRSIAACASIDSRFIDTFRLADQAGKAVAVLASAVVARALGKSMALANKDAALGNAVSNTLGSGFRLASVSNIDAKLAGAARVAGFTAMGAILPPLLDAFGVSASNKSAILGVLFNVLRYGSDLLTGNLVADLGFEAVFNLARIATDAAVLEVLTGVELRPDLPYPYSVVSAEMTVLSGSPAAGASFQSAITLTGGLVYSTNTDTPQVLSALDKYDASQHKLVTAAQATTAPINSFASLINGMNGVLQLQTVAGAIGGYPLTKYQFYLQKTLTQAQSALNTVVGKVGSTAAKAGNQIAFVALGVAGAGVISQTLAVTFIPNLAANSVLFGTTAIQQGVLPPSMPAIASMDAASDHVASTEIITAAASAGSTDAAAYLADLTSMSSLVKKHDTADIPALYTTLTTDDQTLFRNDLEPLDAQASTAFAQVEPAKRSVLENFDAELNEAEDATLLANLQLSAWAAAPATGNTAAVVTQFARATAAVQAAAAGAAAVRTQLAGKTLPATLVITETSVPTDAAAGSTQTITVSITNIGSQATAAGTVGFSNDDGGLTVQGSSEQSLPALDPGTSATASFSVIVSAPTNGDPAPAYQITAVAADVAAQLTDTVVLGS